MTFKRKLIEVALPLEVINVASGREKGPFTKNHPRAMHMWWARRPLAACRAVLFASLVDDPSSDADRFPTPKAVEDERTRLFGIIERIVQWDNITSETVLEEARAEIRRSAGGKLPTVIDPFCGGGSIPLEAQRLGLTAYASDLNPVAVLITKALVEIPPKFANRPPVHPDARRGVGATGDWAGAAGLAEDVRRYGTWVRDEAERRIGHLYPKVRSAKEHGGNEAKVAAWLWARTVTCPNPACGAQMPLVRSFALSTKKGKEAWVEPIVDRVAKTVRFEVRTGRGTPPQAPKVGRGANFSCLVCGQVAAEEHLRAEGAGGRMSTQLLAVVVEGDQGRGYVSGQLLRPGVDGSETPDWVPLGDLSINVRHSTPPTYGMRSFSDLFTRRQLVGLTTLADLVSEGRAKVAQDAAAVGLAPDGVRLANGGLGAEAYADAVSTYLALAVSRLTDFHNSLASWDSGNTNLRQLFVRQAIPMSWDFAEASLIHGPVTMATALEWVSNSLDAAVPAARATVEMADATTHSRHSGMVVSTDPPYYDNVPYADLADFYYVWLRRSLGEVWPDMFQTLLTPKANELVADPLRQGGRLAARDFFDAGMSRAFQVIRSLSEGTDYPTTIYYAFKQVESATQDDGSNVAASTGWSTMLEGLVAAGYAVNGTWPLRTEQAQRSRASESNALASSIVLVCRPRQTDAGITTRKDFVASLKREMPEALRTLQHGNIAPVDLAQSSIGPGMAIFSRYARVLEPDGAAMRVRTALVLINQVLDEILSEQEGEFDPDTRWAIAWYDQFGLKDAAYGAGETLATAKNTSVAGLVQAGIVAASRGRVRLLGRNEYGPDWDPAKDTRLPVWEATQRLVHSLLTGGEAPAGDLLARLGGLGDTARDLAYRMYHVAERKGWTDEARAYNALVVAWTDLSSGAESARPAQPTQTNLGLE